MMNSNRELFVVIFTFYTYRVLIFFVDRLRPNLKYTTPCLTLLCQIVPMAASKQRPRANIT